jgi:MFS family permease
MADVTSDKVPKEKIFPEGITFRRFADLILILTGSVFTGLLTIAPAPVLHDVADHFVGFTLFDMAVDEKFVAQMIMVFPAIGVVLAGFFVGTLIDKYGVRRILLVSAASYAVLGTLGVVLENLPLLLLSRFLLGMAGSGIYGSTFTLAGERFSGPLLGRVLGYKGAIGAGTATVTVLLAGQIGTAFGWRAVFGLYLVAGLLFLLAWGTQNTVRKRETAGVDEPKQSFKPIIDMWPVFLTMTLIFAATFSTHSQGAFLLRENGVDPTDFKTVIASGSFAYMIASAIYGHIRGLLGEQTIFRLGLTFVGFGALGAAFLTEAWYYTALSFGLYGLGNGLTAPYLHAYVLHRAPVHARGRASALVSPTHYGGEFLNPFIFSVFMFAGGIHEAFMVLSACMFAAAFLLRPDGWRRLEGSPAAASAAVANAASLSR